jgi:hypothetical protein
MELRLEAGGDKDERHDVIFAESAETGLTGCTFDTGGVVGLATVVAGYGGLRGHGLFRNLELIE